MRQHRRPDGKPDGIPDEILDEIIEGVPADILDGLPNDINFGNGTSAQRVVDDRENQTREKPSGDSSHLPPLVSPPVLRPPSPAPLHLTRDAVSRHTTSIGPRDAVSRHTTSIGPRRSRRLQERLGLGRREGESTGATASEAIRPSPVTSGPVHRSRTNGGWPQRRPRAVSSPRQPTVPLAPPPWRTSRQVEQRPPSSPLGAQRRASTRRRGTSEAQQTPSPRYSIFLPPGSHGRHPSSLGAGSAPAVRLVPFCTPGPLRRFSSLPPEPTAYTAAASGVHNASPVSPLYTRQVMPPVQSPVQERSRHVQETRPYYSPYGDAQGRSAFNSPGAVLGYPPDYSGYSPAQPGHHGGDMAHSSALSAQYHSTPNEYYDPGHNTQQGPAPSTQYHPAQSTQWGSAPDAYYHPAQSTQQGPEPDAYYLPAHNTQQGPVPNSHRYGYAAPPGESPPQSPQHGVFTNNARHHQYQMPIRPNPGQAQSYYQHVGRGREEASRQQSAAHPPPFNPRHLRGPGPGPAGAYHHEDRRHSTSGYPPRAPMVIRGSAPAPTGTGLAPKLDPSPIKQGPSPRKPHPLPPKPPLLSYQQDEEANPTPSRRQQQRPPPKPDPPPPEPHPLPPKPPLLSYQQEEEANPTPSRRQQQRPPPKPDPSPPEPDSSPPNPPPPPTQQEEEANPTPNRRQQQRPRGRGRGRGRKKTG
ncbi:hypothetical protein F5B17DRAFT_287249 [Nemania serpens]|nr:hypothetical protein F5B17DRAFT_287249 [Nemania serpens]